MKKPRTKVEEAIAELEQAREDYRREEFRKGIRRDFLGKPVNQLQVVVENLKNYVQYMFPAKLVEDDGNNAARRKYAETMDLVATDLDVSNDQLPAETLRMYRSMVARWGADCEDIEKAYEGAVSELNAESNPFKSDKDATRFSNFMTELSLVGGPAKTADELAEQVRRSLNDGDSGGLQFWSRNLPKLASQIPDLSMHEHSMFESLERDVNSTISSKRTAPQREAAQRVKALQSAWEINAVDSALSTARFVVAEAKNQTLRDMPPWYQPRPRTTSEEKTAAGRALIREAAAE